MYRWRPMRVRYGNDGLAGKRARRIERASASPRHVYSPHVSRARIVRCGPKGCDMHHTPAQHRCMRRFHRAATLAVTSCLVAIMLPFGQAQSPTTYTNPVLPGDYPDPSVIRAGDTFWATATTSQWAPLFPLLKSDRPGELGARRRRVPGSPAWSAGSYWAPEIAEDRGRFFVYYTARRKNGPLCVAVASASRPRGTVHGSRAADLPGGRLHRCSAGRGRGGSAISRMEGRRQQPQDADAHLDAAALRQTARS